MGVVAHVSSDGHMRMANTEMSGLPICNQFQAKDFQMFFNETTSTLRDLYSLATQAKYFAMCATYKQ